MNVDKAERAGPYFAHALGRGSRKLPSQTLIMSSALLCDLIVYTGQVRSGPCPWRADRLFGWLRISMFRWPHMRIFGFIRCFVFYCGKAALVSSQRDYTQLAAVAAMQRGCTMVALLMSAVLLLHSFRAHERRILIWIFSLLDNVHRITMYCSGSNSFKHSRYIY